MPIAPFIRANRLKWHSVDFPISEGVESAIFDTLANASLIKAQVLSRNTKADRLTLIVCEINDRRLDASRRHAACPIRLRTERTPDLKPLLKPWR